MAWPPTSARGNAAVASRRVAGERRSQVFTRGYGLLCAYASRRDRARAWCRAYATDYGVGPQRAQSRPAAGVVQSFAARHRRPTVFSYALCVRSRDFCLPGPVRKTYFPKAVRSVGPVTVAVRLRDTSTVLDQTNRVYPADNARTPVTRDQVSGRCIFYVLVFLCFDIDK